MIKPLEKLGRTMNPTSTGSQIKPIFQSLFNTELLVVHLFYHPKEIVEIFLKIKSLEKLEKTVNLINMRSPIHPRWQYLLKIILIVTHFFYYPIKMDQMTLLIAHFFYYLKKMATCSRSALLPLFMIMEQMWHKTQVISSS